MIIKTDFLLPFASAAVLVLLVGLPLTGLPPGVPGIPVWYQDSFFIAWAVLGVGAVFVAFVIVRTWLAKNGFRNRIRWNVVDTLVFILGMYILLRILFQEVVPQSSWIQMGFLFGTYFVGRGLFSLLDKDSIPWLVGGILLVGIAQSAYGLGQLYSFWPSHHNLFPITGSFFNPGPYSGWLACIVPVAVYSIISRKSTVLPVLGWIYIFICGLVLIPAGSRAGILAALAGAGIVLWPRVKALKLWKSRAIKIGIGGVLIVLLAGLYFIKKDSADGRLLIWKVTGDMIADHPLFGVGWDRFSMYYNNYQALYFANGGGTEREKYLADSVVYGFNEGLEWTAEFGLAGFVLVILTGYFLFKRWENAKEDQPVLSSFPKEIIVALAVLISWLIFSMFSYPLSVPILAMVGPLSLAGLNTGLSQGSGQQEKCNISEFPIVIFRMTFIIIVLGISVYGTYWISYYRPFTQQWINANATQELGQYEMANILYKKLYPHFRDEGLFLQYAGKSHSLARDFGGSEQLLERSLYLSSDPVIFTTLGKDYTLFGKVDPDKMIQAEKLLKLVKYIQPRRYYPRYLLMNLYNRNGNKKRCKDEAIAILNLDIKIDSKAVQEIRMKARKVAMGDLLELEIEETNNTD